MSKITRKFVVVGPEGDVVFNSHCQSVYFRTLGSAVKAVNEELDEPESQDMDTLKIHTKRTDGFVLGDYKLFQRIQWPRS